MVNIPVEKVGEIVVISSNKPQLKTDYETGEILEDEQGMNTYLVSAMVAGEEQVDSFRVQVKATENPVAKLKPMQPIKFENLRVSLGKLGTGGMFYSFKADAVKAA